MNKEELNKQSSVENTARKPTEKELQDYKEFVDNLVERDEDIIFLNYDEKHALIVLSKIFDTSQNVLRILAGTLCDYVGREPEYTTAISSFIRRGGVVKILLNNSPSENQMKQSELFQRLMYYASIDMPIEVKKTTAKPYLTLGENKKKEVHFTLGDEKMYRIETDIEKREASCNMNGQKTTKLYADFFDNLFDNSQSTPIDLKALYI